MRIGLFNCRGLSGKDQIILDFMQHQQLDIMFLLETWLRPSQIPPIRGNIAFNITQPFTRGQRSRGGILCVTNANYRDMIQTVWQDPNNNYVVLETQVTIIAVGYFPPSAPHQALINFMEKAVEIADNKDLVLMGDFNARLGKLMNDSRSNRRGNILLEFLQTSTLMPWQPVRGRWTTVNSEGQGVTDLVLSNGIHIADLEIHEEESQGGSDHRPICFHFTPSEALPTKDFSRWNVRKLAQPQIMDKFKNILSSTYDRMMENMSLITGNDQTEDDPQNRVEKAWLLIKEWIEHSLEYSTGKTVYNNSSNRNFWTPELLRKKEEIITKTTDLQYLLNSTRPNGPERRRTVQALDNLNKG